MKLENSTKRLLVKSFRKGLILVKGYLLNMLINLLFKQYLKWTKFDMKTEKSMCRHALVM